MERHPMRELLSITKALADENRLRALYALRSGELCLCQIIELLGLAPSTVSRHMAILWQARLVEGRKEGRWIYYRLMGTDRPVEVQKAIAWICGALTKTKRIQEDGRRLKKILCIDPEELCRKHRYPGRFNEEFCHLERKSKKTSPRPGQRGSSRIRKTFQGGMEWKKPGP